MIRTAVSNGNDALNLLFEAAHHESHTAGSQSLAANVDDSTVTSSLGGETLRNATDRSSPNRSNPYAISELPTDLIETWNAYRFVKMGWFSAEEAVTYVDL